MLNTKIALVTGAGGGIGKAVSLALLEDGFKVVLAGRRLEMLEVVAQLAKNKGQEAFPVSVDVRDPESVQQLFAAIEKRYGRLDVAFNNAGVNAPAVTIDELPLEKWQNAIDTNVTGVFLCARAEFG